MLCSGELWKTKPLRPFAESVIRGYQELVSPSHNNLNGHCFIDHLERSDVAGI
jgi:hypothetical protein